MDEETANVSTSTQYESIEKTELLSNKEGEPVNVYEAIGKSELNAEPTVTDKLKKGLKNVHKVVLKYIGIVYGTAGFLIISSLLLLFIAFALQKFAKHPNGSPAPLVIVGPSKCRNSLSKCYDSSNASPDRNLCMALFKQCIESTSTKIASKQSTQLVPVKNNHVMREDSSECSVEFKDCLIEAAGADKRIRKYYFEGCLDNLKSCMKHENLGGKIGTCLAITGVCIAGTFYIPPEAVFVCSGVAATCAGYTLFSSFF